MMNCKSIRRSFHIWVPDTPLHPGETRGRTAANSHRATLCTQGQGVGTALLAGQVVCRTEGSPVLFGSSAFTAGNRCLHPCRSPKKVVDKLPSWQQKVRPTLARAAGTRPGIAMFHTRSLFCRKLVCGSFVAIHAPQGKGVQTWPARAMGLWKVRTREGLLVLKRRQHPQAGLPLRNPLPLQQPSTRPASRPLTAGAGGCGC